MNLTSSVTSVRPYVPLIAFVVPTLVIGYGIVIPRSCIAGVNELTIGFGTTVAGAVLTYVAGQRAVLPKGVCNKAPLFVRMARALNRQAASPSGLVGRVLGLIWPHEHGRLNAEVLGQLDLAAGQRVLEIGFGTGHALREAARRVAPGQAVGLDVSALMVSWATRRSRAAIARGEIELRAGDIASLSLDERAFDRIFTVHCVYFWRDLDGALGKLAATLAPGGKLVLAFRPDGDDIPLRFRDRTYRFPRVEDIEGPLERSGLALERVVPSASERGVVLLSAVRR